MQKVSGKRRQIRKGFHQRNTIGAVVEAAYIIPIMIIVTIAMIMIFLRLFNMVKLEVDTDLAIYRGEEHFRLNKELSIQRLESYVGIGCRRYFGSARASYTVSEEKKGFNVKTELNGINYDTRLLVIDRTELLWKISVAKELAADIQAVRDSIINEFQEGRS